MIYLIAGKLMNYLVFNMICELLQNHVDLTIFERLIGWFLIENTFEEYDLTAGKKFLVNEDFRTLIKNVILLIRNFAFLAQVFNPLEFLVINVVLISVFLIRKPKFLKNTGPSIFLISYLLLLQSFLCVNFFSTIILIKHFLLVWLFFVCLFFYLYIVYVHSCIYNSSKVKTTMLFLLTKLFFCTIFGYLISLTVLVYFFQELLFLSDNFVIEYVLLFCIPYSYLYF